jgi:hypothetical protein
VKVFAFPFFDIHTKPVSPPSHITRLNCVRLVWDMWTGYVCYHTWLGRRFCLFLVASILFRKWPK